MEIAGTQDLLNCNWTTFFSYGECAGWDGILCRWPSNSPSCLFLPRCPTPSLKCKYCYLFNSRHFCIIRICLISMWNLLFIYLFYLQEAVTFYNITTVCLFKKCTRCYVHSTVGHVWKRKHAVSVIYRIGRNSSSVTYLRLKWRGATWDVLHPSAACLTAQLMISRERRRSSHPCFEQNVVQILFGPQLEGKFN